MALAEHQQIAAADCLLGQTGLLLANELAVHHRDTPEPPSPDALRHLPAIAEESERGAELQTLLARKAGEAGGAWTRQHALADAIAELGLELVRVHGEEQHGDAGPPVERLVGRERPLDACLRAAGDHRSGEPCHGARGNQGPFEGGRSDDDPRADHGEGLGESLDDGDAFDAQISHGRALRPLPHLMQVSGAPLNSWRKWRKRGDEAGPDLQPTVAISGNLRGRDQAFGLSYLI